MSKRYIDQFCITNNHVQTFINISKQFFIDDFYSGSALLTNPLFTE